MQTRKHHTRKMGREKNRHVILQKLYVASPGSHNWKLQRLIHQHPAIDSCLHILHNFWDFTDQKDEREIDQALERILEKIRSESY